MVEVQKQMRGIDHIRENWGEEIWYKTLPS